MIGITGVASIGVAGVMFWRAFDEWIIIIIPMKYGRSSCSVGGVIFWARDGGAHSGRGAASVFSSGIPMV